MPPHVAALPRALPWKSFLALLSVGLLGVAVLFALAPGAYGPVDLVLLVLAVAVGVLLSRQVGLVSLIADRMDRGVPAMTRLRPHLVPAVIAGLLTGFAVTVLDFGFWYLVGGDPIGGTIPMYPVENVVLGLTYGGFTEELLLRWGLMTVIAWLIWRLAGRSRTEPGAATMWMAIVLAAVLFGVGHLPALAAAGGGFTPEIVVRTIGLNAIAGIVYGWLYWRRCLEAGMIAHGATHIGFLVSIPLVGSLLTLLPWPARATPGANPAAERLFHAASSRDSGP